MTNDILISILHCRQAESQLPLKVLRLVLFSVAVCLFANLSTALAQDSKSTAPAMQEASKTKPEAAQKEAPEAQGPEDQPALTEENFDGFTLKQIEDHFRVRIRDYSKRYRAAPTPKEKRAVARTIPSVAMYRQRLAELINLEPGGEAGLEVVDWWYRRGKRTGDQKDIVELVLKNYSRSELIKKYVPRIQGHFSAEQAQAKLRDLIEHSEFESVQAVSTYELYRLLVKEGETLEGEAAESLDAKAKILRDTIYQKYPEATNTRGVTFVSLLDAVGFASLLAIGKPAPDILGTDLDGVDFKLSDYEGKVRVISFWGIGEARVTGCFHTSGRS